MSFKASYDTMAKLVSAIVAGILLTATLATGSPIAAILGLLLVGACYAWSPQGYVVAERSIQVRRLIGNAVFPLESVREARPASPGDLCDAIRLFGSGGMFGYYGLFRTAKLGKCTWYVTNRANSVVVTTDAKTAIFSPDDVEGFLASIRSSVPVPARSALPPPVYKSRGAAPIALFLGLALATLGLAAAGFATLYSPGAPTYKLTPQSLIIHDRFYPLTVQAANVDVDAIRVIDLDTDKVWSPRERTNGFANSHYQAGHYRLSNGRNVRLYRAGSRQLVLLPARGSADSVLLCAADPLKLAAEIRREWK